MKKQAYIKVWKGKSGQWRISLIAKNGRILMTSEDYHNMTGVNANIRAVKKLMEEAHTYRKETKPGPKEIDFDTPQILQEI